MSKYYFLGDDEEACYSKKYWKEYAIENNMESIELFEAKRMIGQDFFFCKEYFEVGLKHESCGRLCDGYKPRNGKNGRCVHSGYCYEATDKKIIIYLNSDKEVQECDARKV